MAWTKEEDDKLKQLYYDNLKIKDIADILSKTSDQVKVRKSKLGYVDRNRKEAYRAHLPKELNDIEEQVIYGSLLGDGMISCCKKKQHNYVGYHFRDCHSIKQKDYLQWKLPFLKRWNAKIYDDAKYPRVSLYTPYHEVWERIHNEIYPNNRKTITVEWLQKIDYLGLSVLIGDDGTKHGSGCVIATNNFNKEEHDLIVDVFSEKFGTHFKVGYKPSVGYYNIFIPALSYKSLLKKLPIPTGVEYKFK